MHIYLYVNLICVQVLKVEIISLKKAYSVTVQAKLML